MHTFYNSFSHPAYRPREKMFYSLGKSTLGSLLVAHTEKGVCVISLGDDPQLLLEDLYMRFPQSYLVEGGKNLEKIIGSVVTICENPRRKLRLPLDLRGTEFQLRVWEALRAIPARKTRSYADIARQIGQPKAVRAVAGACGANPLAIAVPCHRVLRKDGALGGYRWGIERKKILLEREVQPS